MIDKVELSAKVEHPFIEGIAVMGKAIIVFAAIAIQLLIPAAGSPAAAVSADLANRCRTMAIKSHPPVPGKAYAQAERDFFRNCVARNGRAQDGAPLQTPAKPPD